MEYIKSQKYNSVLWLIDKETGKYLKTLALDDIDHVGAITYDEDHQRLWVAAVNKNHRAQAEALNLSTIENYDFKKSQKPIAFDDSSNLSDITLASSIWPIMIKHFTLDTLIRLKMESWQPFP